MTLHLIASSCLIVASTNDKTTYKSRANVNNYSEILSSFDVFLIKPKERNDSHRVIMSKCQSVKMKMRWVTKFNLGVKQVLIRQSGTALEQEQSEVSKKGPASADGREAERRGGRNRNGCCLSEASFIHFPTAAKRSSPDGAALTFWFFWVKPKERNHFSSEFFFEKIFPNY